MSLTPLIDVVFILLVFFMLASSFAQWRAFPLQGEGADAGAPEDMPAPMVIRVGADGTLRLQNEIIATETLHERASTHLAEAPNTRFQIWPHAEAKVDAIVGAMDTLAGAGVRDVILVRQED